MTARFKQTWQLFNALQETVSLAEYNKLVQIHEEDMMLLQQEYEWVIWSCHFPSKNSLWRWEWQSLHTQLHEGHLNSKSNKKSAMVIMLLAGTDYKRWQRIYKWCRMHSWPLQVIQLQGHPDLHLQGQWHPRGHSLQVEPLGRMCPHDHPGPRQQPHSQLLPLCSEHKLKPVKELL